MARQAVTKRNLLAVEGTEEVLKNISAIIDRTTGKELKKLYLKGALVVSEQARANIDALGVSPELKTVLKAAVVTNIGPDRKPNAISGVNQWAAMRRLGGKESGLRFPNPYWFEYGVTDRRTEAGKATGNIQATPFFRPAVVLKKAAVRDVLAEGLKEIIFRADQAKAEGRNERREFFD